MRVRLGFAVLAGVLVSPHLITYDVTLLALPLLWLADWAKGRGTERECRNGRRMVVCDTGVAMVGARPCAAVGARHALDCTSGLAISAFEQGAFGTRACAEHVDRMTAASQRGGIAACQSPTIPINALW